MELLPSQDYPLVRELTPGHTDCQVALYENDSGEPVILKTSRTESGQREILANLDAFDEISQAGGDALLPRPYKGGLADGMAYLEMPFLGWNITQRLNDDEPVNWPGFFDGIDTTVLASTIEQPGQQQAGLQNYLQHIGEWFTRITEIAPSDSQPSPTALIRRIDPSRLVSGDNTTLMLLDFTPDNTFYTDGQAKFIDPWLQDTYQGSFIPSLGQFRTLLSEVYGHRLALNDAVRFNKSVALVAETLELTREQQSAQLCMGAALQYGLSAYVRQQGDPAKAREYYNKGYAILQRLADENCFCA